LPAKPWVDQRPERLENIATVDQHGREVILNTLRGKFVLADFIYTSCPGVCSLTTSRMVKVANFLGSVAGNDLIPSMTIRTGCWRIREEKEQMDANGFF